LLAQIRKHDNGYTACYERHLKHSVEEVWSYLIENDKLSKWFPELRVEELREGGLIKFDMGNGFFEEMRIIELKLHSVLEYTWGEDTVRFELSQQQDGCLFVLIEKINTITDHTPRDLAGWHVCLDVIDSLLNGYTIKRKEEWKNWYEKYVQAVNHVKN
jgi:uncharacterized protein YndB with AHSA1/START domain